MAAYNFGRDQFVTNGGTVYVQNTSHTENSVLQKLSPHVAFSALHNDKGRGSQMGCLEGTREDFLGKLSDWIEKPKGRSRVYWVRGAAGVGKSAIAQTLCERYFGTHLAASFLFSRDDDLRNHMDRFVASIVYQLVESEGPHSPYTSIINGVFRDYPRIMHVGWEEQFERLIRQPCAQVELTSPCRLVVIDGLDECMDRDPRTKEVDQKSEKKEGQARLLFTIQHFTSSQSRLPLRFLIFSRPEHAISNFLRAHEFTPEIEQFDMRKLRAEADRDIGLYIRHELVKFQAAHPHAGFEVGEEAIQTLTRKADSHFIYIVTVMKYITSSSLLAWNRLISVLHSGPSSQEDLSDLDHLYHHILRSITYDIPLADSTKIREEMLLPLLRLLLTPHYRPVDYGDLDMTDFQAKWRSKHAIGRMLKLDMLCVGTLLSWLNSVLDIPDNEHNGDVSFLHASFVDFLSNERRSQEFYVQSMSRYTYFDILSPYLDDWMYSITKLEKVFRLEARGWVLESYGGMIQIHNLPHGSRLLGLSTQVAFSALHKARGPESGCLDGTRTDLIRTIGDWIETPSERSRICWVRGGAGTGKSAIAQTLCEKYLHIHLAANFSFSRNDRTRNGLDSLIPTIAYQLATEPAFQQAGLASFIDEAIPRAVDWGWEFERLFKQLITDPCLRVDPNRWKDLPTVIIIDGLDECNEEERQQEKLLSVIHESTFALPIRFVIFSRPEPTILNFFRTTPSISTTAHELDMRDFRAEADRDIKVYLYHRFAFVRSSYPEVIVGNDWPGEEAIQRLAHKADAHFVYVVTAVNYIARKDSSPPLPQQRLDAVLRGEKNSLYPDLTDLDQLFHHILQSVMETHELTLLPVLQLLITPHYRPRNDGQLPPGMPTLEIKWRTRYAMGRLLNMDPHQVASVLSGLYSVLYIPDGNEHDGDVAFLHAPFSDFLRDERRSHRFHVKPIETWSDVPRRRRRSFASRPKKSHSSSISISPSSSFPSPTEFPDSPDALGYFDRLLPYLDDWRNAISRLKELSEQENREEESRIQITRMSILL